MKKVHLLWVAVLMLAATSCDQLKNKPADTGDEQGNVDITLENKIDSVSYGIGLITAKNLVYQGYEAVNVTVLAQAIRDVLYQRDLLIDDATAEQVIRDYLTEVTLKKAETNKKQGEEFLVENKQKDGVVTLDNGLQYLVLEEGTGPVAKAQDTVVVHYTGKFLDGTVFDSSVERGQPAKFTFGNNLIEGLKVALRMMPEGSKWIIYVPPSLAYGERGAGPIGPNSTLVFEIELLKVIPAKQ